MKKYSMPNVEFSVFSVDGIITASGDIVSYDTLTGENAQMYEIYKENSEVQNTNISVFTW